MMTDGERNINMLFEQMGMVAMMQLNNLSKKPTASVLELSDAPFGVTANVNF